VKSLRGFFQLHTDLFALAFVGAFAVAIYAYVLPLPFFRDDMVMLLWLRDMPWGKLWMDATGFPYYRPLSFSTLKLSELIFGWPEPISLHMLNLVLHATNSMFVALLALQFFEGKGKRIAAISAGLLFAAYPFSYEIVPTTGPIFQLQAVFFGLSSALAYMEFRSTLHASHAPSQWLWVSLALALLGAFTCEYGVIIPALVVLTEAMLGWRGRPMIHHRADHAQPAEAGCKFSLIPFAYFAFSAIYLVAWALVPKSRAEPPLILQGLTPMLKNMPVTGLYYLQGLTYPLQTLAGPLVRATGMSQPLAVGLIAFVTWAAIVALFAWARRLRLLVFALAWFAVTLAPMWPMLNADYTLNGPRLHYLPSIATSLIWGSLVAILFCHSQPLPGQESLPRKIETRSFRSGRVLRFAPGDTLGQALAVIVLGATLAQSLVFLYGMADIITLGGRLTADVSRAVAATPSDEPSLVVNFPSWIGKRETETTFALGAEGISFLPGYSTLRDLVRLNTRQDRNVTEVTFTNTIQEWKYDQRLGLLVNWNKLVRAMRAARHVWTIEYLPERLHLSEAGSIRPAEATPPEVTFGERIGLRVANASAAPDELRVELAWTNVLTVDRQLTAFVHVYNAEGQLVAQQDGYPLLGLYPPWLAQPGEAVRDLRHILLPASLASGHYQAGVGLYDAETSQRVAAISATGNRLENDVYLFYGFDMKRK
jgi:hypothetical protein